MARPGHIVDSPLIDQTVSDAATQFFHRRPVTKLAVELHGKTRRHAGIRRTAPVLESEAFPAPLQIIRVLGRDTISDAVRRLAIACRSLGAEPAIS